MLLQPDRSRRVPAEHGGAPFPSRGVPEKERRGGRADLTAARRCGYPPRATGRLTRSGRRALRAGGSVREGRHPVTREAARA